MARQRRRAAALALGGVACAASAGCGPLGDGPRAADTPSSTPSTVTVTPSPTTTPSTTPSGTSPPSPSAASGDDWEARLYDQVKSGVVRLQVVGCEGTWMGSGFLVGDDTIVTAGHVADGASTISVQGVDGITGADVVGSDLSTDTAVLRAASPIDGHRFEVADQAPGPGTDIVVLGYPFGVHDTRLSAGTISSGSISTTYGGEEGFTVDRVVSTDAATNGGSSGGPALDRAGRVVGLVSGGRYWDGDPDNPVPAQGDNYLVPGDVITDRYLTLRDDVVQAPAPCPGDESAPVEEEFVLDVSIESDDPAAADVTQTLYTYGDSINQGSYDAAWSLLTPELRSRMGDFDAWSGGLASSYWDELTVYGVESGDGQARVRAAFRTLQDADAGPDGQTCSDWDVEYSMVLDDGTWLVDRARAAGEPSAC